MKSVSLRRKRQAFTLVELLVVIGIIALLISILMPAMKKAKESADGIKCGNNTRTLMTAFLMFAQDYKNQLPGNKHDADDFRADRGKAPHFEEHKTDWLMGRRAKAGNINNAPTKGTIWKYVRNRSVYACPTEEGNGNITGLFAGTNERFDYAFFGCFPGTNISKIKNQSQFIDNYTGHKSMVPTPIIVQEHPRSINGANIEGGHSYSDKMASSHKGGSYYASIDGSVHYFIEVDKPGVAKNDQKNTSRTSWFHLRPATGTYRTMGTDFEWGDFHNKTGD